MHKIYIIMGKSASGKDSIYNEVLNRVQELHTITPCTTRPKRDNETGNEYHFVTKEEFENDLNNNNVIEYRTYETIHGPWTYYERSEDVDLRRNNYLTISTLEGYQSFVEKYGEEDIIPIYIDINEETRLYRAISRELQQNTPQIKELARRFIADQVDFSNENLDKLGIEQCFSNNGELEECVKKVVAYISLDIMLRNNKRHSEVNFPKGKKLKKPQE